LLAEGKETADHVRLLNLMNANLLTLEEVTEMQNLNLE
jgi:hypothetical protein